MGNSDTMFRQLMSDLRHRMETNWSTGPDKPDDGAGRMMLPSGPAQPVLPQVPSREPEFDAFNQRFRPVAPPEAPQPDPRVSRSGGFAPQEPTPDEMLAFRDRVARAKAAMWQSQLSPFQLQRQELRQYKVVRPESTPEELAARDQQMLKSILQQHSSASGGYAPQEPAPPPDWKARLEDLERRARQLKGDYSVAAPADLTKLPKGKLI